MDKETEIKNLKRLKEELARRAAVPAPPRSAAPPAAHGSMYQEFRGRINEVVTMFEIGELSNELFDILEHEEFTKLTKLDITELLEELRKVGERRAIKLAEIKLPGVKPVIRKLPPERAEVPFIGVLPPQVMHRYSRPDIEEAEFAGIRFTRDYELERTIMRNNLLLFPPQWYGLPPEEKRGRYGWDIASALRHSIEYLHRYSWEDLTKDFGIPDAYVKVWRETK